MFSNTSNIVINRSTFVDSSNNYGRDALQLLSQYVAQGATHDSRDEYDAPKCHPDTRKQLLGDIIEWMREPHKETGILYLHGPAGAGKSCIARSACELAGSLRASFFFLRGSDERNNTAKLFTTIAYQLAMFDDELAGYIFAAIQKDPRLVKDAPAALQFRRLILEPCRRVRQSGRQLEGAIVIDALDECVDKESQLSVIRLLANALRHREFALGFFITSRSELHLKEAWTTEDVAYVTQLISLSEIPNASNDIRTVLESGFSCVLNDRRFKVAFHSVPRPWPSQHVVETLVERSSGQFIYAATVLKFITSRSHNPDAQLQIVLGLRHSNTSPLADVDSLYHEILSRADDPTRTIKVLAYILTIMDVREKRQNVSHFDVSRLILLMITGDLDKFLLIIEQMILLPQGEALFALNGIHSLIDIRAVPMFAGGYLPISFYHKSFNDFLLTKGRSKEFYVDIQATHAEIDQLCLNILNLSNYVTVEQHVLWLYSFFLWHSHVYESGRWEEIDNFAQPIQRFIGTQQVYFNKLHLDKAFKLLGHWEIKEVVEVLTGVRPLCGAAFTWIRVHLWGWQIDNFEVSMEFPSFKDSSSIYYPLLFAHLKSYKKDLLVKRSLALQAIMPLHELTTSGLYSMGTIYELTSFSGMRRDISDLFPPGSGVDILRTFLSSHKYSGIFSCTAEDFADAYVCIINTPIHVSVTEQEQRYSQVLNLWTRSLQDVNPAATSKFLRALKMAARDTHDQPSLNRALTHKAEVYLLNWLEELPSPPLDILHLWQKSFDKARRAPFQLVLGRYFCDMRFGIDVCPTITWPTVTSQPFDWELTCQALSLE